MTVHEAKLIVAKYELLRHGHHCSRMRSCQTCVALRHKVISRKIRNARQILKRLAA